MPVWFWLGSLGFAGYLPGVPTEVRLLNPFFLVTPLLALVRRRRPIDAAPPPPVPDLPLPPPAGGGLMFFLRIMASQVLVLFSPVMWPQMLRQERGGAKTLLRVVEQAEQYRQRVRYRLPFPIPPTGTWLVLNGGITPKTSHSWDIPGQRYAYDFVVVDHQYRRWRTDGRAVTDYLCCGLPVIAPADGEIVGLCDGLPDAPGVGTGWIDPLARHFPGCTVTIRHADGEYSLLAHLVSGSLRVSIGDHVRAGQVIGLCGHSGHSTEPHLHFQVQDKVDFWSAAGLPIAFADVQVEGQPAEDVVYLVRGQRVTPSAHA